MAQRFCFALFLFMASACTPVPTENELNEEPTSNCGPFGSLQGCKQSAPGELPDPATQIGKLAKQCERPRYCGIVGFVDCGAAVDGPAYYFERHSGRVTGYCGGYCMGDFDGKCAATCPPPDWDCTD